MSDLPAARLDPLDAGFGIYIHWPFCAAKCPYCDFNSHVRHQRVDEARFVQALQQELRWFAAQTGRREVTSVFFGGGTPSLMSAGAVDSLLQSVSTLWPMAPDAEITLEANPSSADAARFAGYRAAGVNRLSLGVQSFDDAALRFLGRLHSAAEARAAIALARDVFERLSFDLIYARPNQSLGQWEEELGLAFAEAVDHLSLYQLTIEQETPFFALHQAGKLTPPDEETARRFYDLTQQLCAAQGLPAYEISNHAREGCESRHNLIYWRSGSWVGVGPGAHGRLDTAAGRLATSTEKYPEHWLEFVERDGHGVVLGEKLLRGEQADEFLLMGLRLREGIDVARFETLAGRGFSASRVATLVEEGMVELTSDGRLRVTPAGFPVLNAVVADLAAEEI